VRGERARKSRGNTDTATTAAWRRWEAVTPVVPRRRACLGSSSGSAARRGSEGQATRVRPPRDSSPCGGGGGGRGTLTRLVRHAGWILCGGGGGDGDDAKTNNGTRERRSRRTHVPDCYSSRENIQEETAADAPLRPYTTLLRCSSGSSAFLTLCLSPPPPLSLSRSLSCSGDGG
jgi:hypothetical protein